MKSLITMCLGLIMLGFTHPVYAQQVSMNFNHAIQEAQIKPGSRAILNYKFTNLGDPGTFSFTVIGIEQKNMTGETILRSLTAQEIQFTILNPEMSLDKPLFIKSKETIDIQLELIASSTLPERDYYYSFLAQAQPQPKLEGKTQIRVQNSIGSNVLVRVNMNETRIQPPNIALFAIKTKMKLPFFGETIFVSHRNDAIPLYVTVENPSETFTNVHGSVRLVEIKRNKTHEIQQYPIPRHFIASNYQKLLSTTSSICPDKDDPNCRDPASAFIQLKKIGIYQLSATIYDNNNNQVSSNELQFFVIPLWELITLFCTIFALTIIFLIFRYTKK